MGHEFVITLTDAFVVMVTFLCGGIAIGSVFASMEDEEVELDMYGNVKW